MQKVAVTTGYERLDGPIPLAHAPGKEDLAEKVRSLLAIGAETLPKLLGVEPPRIEALLVADDDWKEAPRESKHAYPLGLPYFTRSVRPPALVLPEMLSLVFRPHTEATYPLAVWHELAHAFLLQRAVVRASAWLGELIPQAASVAVARRAGLPLYKHLSEIDREPEFAIRSLKARASAEEQMAFQNLLLALGAEAMDEFGDGFLKELVRALWEETDVVGEERAEEIFAISLGLQGRDWLGSRPEFRGGDGGR